MKERDVHSGGIQVERIVSGRSANESALQNHSAHTDNNVENHFCDIVISNTMINFH